MKPHRFAIGTYWAHSFVGRSPSHDALGVALEYDATTRFRLGLDAALYGPFNESGVAWPASIAPTEAQASAGIDGRFVVLRRASPSFELYVLGGSGVIATRPVSVVDPSHRTFSYRPKIDFASGIGARMPVSRRIVTEIELRNIIYVERTESSWVAAGSSGKDESTWFGPSRVTSVVQARIGWRGWPRKRSSDSVRRKPDSDDVDLREPLCGRLGRLAGALEIRVASIRRAHGAFRARVSRRSQCSSRRRRRTGVASVVAEAEATSADDVRPRQAAAETGVPVAERTKTAVREHYRFVWRSLRRLGVHEHAVDDAAQQVFCVYARRAHEIASGKDKTFLFGVVLRVAQSARRTQRKDEVADEDVLATVAATTGDPEKSLQARRARAVLDSILEALPLELRTVFILYEIEEMTMAEIATVLDVPSGTVASRLRRAREVFQELSRQMRADTAAKEPR